VHHLIRVICRRVSYHRDVVTKLSGIANSRFDAGVRNQAYDDELMDSMLLELEIQIGVGEAAGAPMLLDDDFARAWREFDTEFATPGAELKGLSRPSRLLNGRNLFPCLIVSRTVSVMHRIENPQLRLTCGIQDLQHMRHALIRLGDGANAIPYLAALRNEVVIGIDNQKCGAVPFVSFYRHVCSRGQCGRRQCAGGSMCAMT
jgi:hypothetical protein